MLANFTSSAGSSVLVKSVPQSNGKTVNDFSNPLTYTVKAQNGTTKNYVVSVFVAGAGDNLNGTISLSGLSWSKCTFGQSWRPGFNDCKGSGTESDNWGATPLQYCSTGILQTACTVNNGNGFSLISPTGGATSTLYNACNSLNQVNGGKGSGNKTGWMVPSAYQLDSLLVCGSTVGIQGQMPYDCSTGSSPFINTSLFPDIPLSSNYWSSTLYTLDGNNIWTAITVLFTSGVNDAIEVNQTSIPVFVRCATSL
ncbi:MAG: DUF1566 domain-containing protein [Leptospira sp.]|nr:DUF1566 domain-containing protein [Leptospira sp.]